MSHMRPRSNVSEQFSWNLVDQLNASSFMISLWKQIGNIMDNNSRTLDKNLARWSLHAIFTIASLFAWDICTDTKVDWFDVRDVL